MARIGAHAGCWPQLASRLATFATAVLILFGTSGAARCESDPVKGEAIFSAAGGFARLVIKLGDEVESEVTTAGSILVIRFKHPVDVPVDAIADAVPDYVGSARRDPDGMAIRLSLSRRVTINTMSAGERLFVDLLPDSWAGAPPSLPADVVRELAERARAAERALRVQRASDAARKRPAIRVRASVQPTFTRFIFEMPDGVSVSSVLNEQKLTLFFNAVLNFDLADAKIAAPANVASINQKIVGEQSAVEIALIGDVDIHSFREDRNYNVDVAFQPAEKAASQLPLAAAPRPAPPRELAAAGPVEPLAVGTQAAPAAPAKPAAAPAAPAKPSEAAPPAADKPVKEAAVEAKGEAKTEPKIEAKIEAKTEAKTEAKIEAKTEAKTEGKIEAKAEPKVETKPAIKPEAAPSPAPETQSAVRPAEEMPAPAAEPMASDNAATVSAIRDSEGLHVTFAFASETPAALFRRADTVWLVFDTTKPLDVAPIRTNGGAIIAEVKPFPLSTGQAIRIRLNRPQMPSLASDGVRRHRTGLSLSPTPWRRRRSR